MAFTPPSPDTLVEEESAKFVPPHPDSLVPDKHEEYAAQMKGLRRERMLTDPLEPLTEGLEFGARLVSRINPLTAIADAAHGLGVQPLVPSEHVRQFIEASQGAPQLPDNVPSLGGETGRQLGKGIEDFAYETASGLTSPEQLALLAAGGAGPKAGEAVQRLFQIGVPGALPDTLKELDRASKAGDIAGTGKGIAGLIAGAAIPAVIEHGITGGEPTLRSLGKELGGQVDRTPIYDPTQNPMVPPAGNTFHVPEEMPAPPVVAGDPGNVNVGKSFTPIPKKKASIPEVPEIPAEPVLEEQIRKAGARTKEEIRQLFPFLNREQAGRLRKGAWGEDAAPEPAVAKAAEPEKKFVPPPPDTLAEAKPAAAPITAEEADAIMAEAGMNEGKAKPAEPEITPAQQKVRDIKQRIKEGIDPKHVQITVSKDAAMPAADYLQVDEVHPEKGNTFSSNPEQLKKLGMDIPSRGELFKLPAGRYTLDTVRQKIADLEKPAEAAKPAEPTKPERTWMSKPLSHWKELAAGKLPPSVTRTQLAKSLSVPDEPRAIQLMLKKRIAEVEAAPEKPTAPAEPIAPVEPVKPETKAAEPETITPKPETKAPVEEAKPQPNDYARYKELEAKLKDAPLEERFSMTAEMEAIKNRQPRKGMPPEPPVEPEAPAVPVEPVKPVEPAAPEAKPAPKFKMTFDEFLNAPREGKLMEEMRKMPKREKTPAEIAAAERYDRASEAAEKAGLGWIFGSSSQTKLGIAQLSKAKRKIADEYSNALNAKVAAHPGEAGQRHLYNQLVEAGVVEDPQAKPKAPAAEAEPAKVETPADQKAAPETSGREQKKYVLEEVDKAIADAPEGEAEQPSKEHYELPKPDEKPDPSLMVGKYVNRHREIYNRNKAKFGTVVIDVPGDGTFEILNNKASLAEFKERAKRFPTSAVRSTEAKGPRSNPSKPAPVGKGAPKERNQALEAFVSTDDTRPVLHNFFSDGSHVVATDGAHMLIVESTAFPGTPEAKKAYTPDGKPAVLGELQQIPSYKQVVPTKESRTLAFKGYDTDRLFTVLRQAAEVVDDKNTSVTFYKNKDGSLGMTAGGPESSYSHNVGDGAETLFAVNPQYIIDALNAARRLGQTKVDIYTGGDPISPIMVNAKGMETVTMPMRLGEKPAGPEAKAKPAAAPGAEVAKLEAPDSAAPAGNKVEPSGKWTSATDDGSKLYLNPIGPLIRTTLRDLQDLGRAVGPAAKASAKYVVEVAQEAQRAGAMTDERKAILNWSAKLQRSFGESHEAQRDINKRVPDPVKQEGITNWIQADGDPAVLKNRLAATTDSRLREGYQAALDLTPDEIKVARDVKAAFDAMGLRAQAHEILNSFVDNYVPQIWKGVKNAGGSSARTLKDKFKFAKARTFDTFFDGEQAGFKPKTKEIGRLLPVYLHEMNSVIAARQLVKEMSGGVGSDGRPLVMPRGGGRPIETTRYAVTSAPGMRARALFDTHALATAALRPGEIVEPRIKQAMLITPKSIVGDTLDYKVLENQPALHDWTWATSDPESGNPVMLKADLAVHPEAYNRLKAVLGKSAIREWYNTKTSAAAQIPKWIVKGLDMGQSEVKRTMLGLISPFHQVQEGTHGIGHRVFPSPIIKSGIAKNLPDALTIPKIDLVNDKAQMDAARHGLMLLPDRASEGQFMEGFRQSGIISKIPILGQAADWYSNYLFHEYIPGLKYKTYQAILERNQKVYGGTGRPLADIKALSAEQANAAYGHLNYADLGRNPTIQHIAQLGLLAPDFLEARARFAGQSVKGVTGSKVGREQLFALATLAISQAALAYTSAKLIDGEWDHRKPFEVTKGNRRYTLRSVPEDIYSLQHNPRMFVHSRLSPIIGKGGLQYIEGRNYKGERVSAGDTTKELAQQPIPISVRGFLGIGNNTLSGFEQLGGSVGLKISRNNPPAEAGARIKDRAELLAPKLRKTPVAQRFKVATEELQDMSPIERNRTLEKLRRQGAFIYQ